MQTNFFLKTWFLELYVFDLPIQFEVTKDRKWKERESVFVDI